MFIYLQLSYVLLDHVLDELFPELQLEDVATSFLNNAEFTPTTTAHT